MINSYKNIIKIIIKCYLMLTCFNKPCYSYTYGSYQQLAYKTRPTESMAIGTPRHQKNNDEEIENFDQEELKPVKIKKSNKTEYYEDSYYDNISDDENISLDEMLEKKTGLKTPEFYQGHFKIGNTYKIFGVSYTPQDYDFFEEEGTASWYGSDFHGKKTANGEIYNMGDITAAHPTLPLPSLIKVTNLENSKTLIVRVNDRGPFSKNRIIDVSEKSAEILGFKNKGTTKVKIEFLRKETDEMLAKLGIGGKKPSIDFEESLETE